MRDHDLGLRESLGEASREMFGAICRAVATTCAAESYFQRGEAALQVSLQGWGCQSICAIHESLYLAALFEKANHRQIESGKLLVLIISAGIVHRPAVKHEAPAIAREILRIAAAI